MFVSASLSQLMEQLDVFISIKPKPKQPSKVGKSWDLWVGKANNHCTGEADYT